MPRLTEPPSLALATKFENEILVQVSQSKPGGPATLVVQGRLSTVLAGLGVFMKQAAAPRTAAKPRSKRVKQQHAAGGAKGGPQK